MILLKHFICRFGLRHSLDDDYDDNYDDDDILSLAYKIMYYIPNL